jgi:hypothetical protein
MHFYAAAGPQLFWELADVARAVGMTEKAILRLNHGLGRSWISVLVEFGVSSGDFLHSHGSKAAEKLLRDANSEGSAEDVPMEMNDAQPEDAPAGEGQAGVLKRPVSEFGE